MTHPRGHAPREKKRRGNERVCLEVARREMGRQGDVRSRAGGARTTMEPPGPSDGHRGSIHGCIRAHSSTAEEPTDRTLCAPPISPVPRRVLQILHQHRLLDRPGWERRDDRVRVSKLPSHRKHPCVPSRRQDLDRRRKRRDQNAGFETGEDETNRPTGPRTSSAPPETRPSARRERDDDAEAAPSRGARKRLECGLERIASGPILHRWTAEEGKRFACSASYNVERRKWPRTGRTASGIALRFIARPWVRKPFAFHAEGGVPLRAFPSTWDASAHPGLLGPWRVH